jgi:hypothetical protein
MLVGNQTNSAVLPIDKRGGMTQYLESMLAAKWLANRRGSTFQTEFFPKKEWKMKEMMNLIGGKKMSMTQLDAVMNTFEQEIKGMFTITSKVNGVNLRVSTAVVVCDVDDNLLLYRRTSEGEVRRGIPENWDTPKGRVKFTASGKWLVPEDQVTGQVVGVGLATEYNALGSKFPEYVHMPLIVFEVDEAGKRAINKHLNDVPTDMGQVAGYEWVPASVIGNAENPAMTKIVVAAQIINDLVK